MEGGPRIPAVWNKIDPGLASVYSDYLRVREHGAGTVPSAHPTVEVGRVRVSVYFTTGLAELEALGFEPSWQEDENRVTGTIDLAKLEAFAEHDGVKRIVFGRKGKRMLNRSIPSIRAHTLRTRTDSAFSGGTGQDVLIGIIDSGIDFRHPFFRSTSPTTTRIRRIWDPGLEPDPTAREQSPAVGLLSGPPETYGVEYTDRHINAELGWRRGNPPLTTPVRHRDCDGHGTHVASIAAGDGRPDYTHIGVAPRAKLIVVKYFDHETAPTVGGVPVNDDELFKDAVVYILRVARSLGRPVVINCSFGSDIGPHDGFTELEDWLTNLFSGGSGTSIVFAAGNAGDARQHARIEFPVGGRTVTIPIDLYEAQPRYRRSFRTCEWQPTAHDVVLDVWYRNGGPSLSAEVDFPGGGSAFVPGPPLGSASPPGTFRGGRGYRMVHSVHSPRLHSGATVARNQFELTVSPHRDRHATGRYTVRLTASGALRAHLWCNQSYNGFQIGTPIPAASAPFVHVEDVNLIGETAGAANTITVASYNAEARRGGDPIVPSSSRGPLVSYGSGPPQPAKPDVAAPGEHIDAAESAHRRPQRWWSDTVPENGTSMSAPHVTGVIALMFQRNPRLTVTQVRDLLRAHVRAGPQPPPDEAGAGRLDARNVYQHVP